MERLLAEDVDIAVTDAQSRTALLYSVLHKHDVITYLLLAHHSALVRRHLNTRKSAKHVTVRQHVDVSTSFKAGSGSRVSHGGSLPDGISDIQVRHDAD